MHIWMRICIYIVQTSMEDRIKNISVLGDPIYISERLGPHDFPYTNSDVEVSPSRKKIIFVFQAL